MLAFKVSLWYILLLHSVLLRKTVGIKMPGNTQHIIFKENTTISLVHTGTLQFVEIFYYSKKVAPAFCSKGIFLCWHIIQNIYNKDNQSFYCPYELLTTHLLFPETYWSLKSKSLPASVYGHLGFANYLQRVLQRYGRKANQLSGDLNTLYRSQTSPGKFEGGWKPQLVQVFKYN